MKKLLVILFAILVFISITGCSAREPIPYDRLEFSQEDNPEYVGSYYITRSNLGETWEETGEWTKAEALLSNTTVCFGYFLPDNYGFFEAANSYHWVETTKEGRNCIKLEKFK